MAGSITGKSPKLENSDSDTPPTRGPNAVDFCVGAARSSSPRTLTAHSLGGVSYSERYFFNETPGATNVPIYVSTIQSGYPTGSSTESYTWSGAMLSDADGDCVVYYCEGMDTAAPFVGAVSAEFTGSTTPPNLSLSGIEPESGDLIFVWIAFNTGGVSVAPSGFTLDVTGEMANLSQGRWYSKESDGTETSISITLTASATGAWGAAVGKAAASSGDIEIDISQDMNSFTQSIQLTEISDHEIAITQTLNSFTQSLQLTEISDLDIDIAQSLNSFTQNIQLTEISDHEIDIVQTLNSFTQSVSISIGAPVVEDIEIDITQSLNSFTQSIQLTEISDHEISITQNLNSFTQSVYIGDLAFNPELLFSDIKTKLSGNITNTNLSADIKTKLSAEV